MIKINNKIQIPMKEIHFKYSRAGGPGGQNVNKVNSKVTLHWNIELTFSLPHAIKERFIAKFSHKINKHGELVLNASRFRDQARNVADVIEKLKSMIEEVKSPPKVRKATKPSKSSQKKRIETKKHHGDKKRGRSKKYY